ncbi:MAG TPA: hypothetical protein VFH68_04415 [Polyangia bacterium]|jgi:hypothetical protein|nr:hypothetical protein [Polyangia bacterium]
MAAPVTSDAGDNFDPIARVVTEREHVYTTVVTATRWFGALVCAGGAGAMGWIFNDALRWDASDPSRWVFAPIFGLLCLSTLAMLFVVLYARARLIISTDGIVLRRRGLVFGRPAVRTWRLDELESVGVGTMQTFHIGGQTPQFHLVLGFVNGESVRFGGAFDDVPSTERAARAIAESARLLSTSA